ncbi:hypothetical protein [Streptomyces sp. NPDC000410]|uniref:hypothetical protein n=1 Tax=Streptomyces sp. NPDC000410 TaxID=3154254 RepID=UPI00333092F7
MSQLRPRAPKLTALLPVIALGTLAALTGCSAGSANGSSKGASAGNGRADTNAQAATVDSIPTLTTRVEKPVPIEGYLLSDKQWVQLGKADEVLRQRCMQRFGLTYKTSTPQQQVPGQTLSEYRYGVLDPQYTSKHGYRTPSALAASAAAGGPAAQDDSAGMSKDERLVLLGTTDPKAAAHSAGKTGGQNFRGQKVPQGGCIGEARQKLGGTPESGIGDAQIANDVNLNSFSKSLEDKRVQDAFAKWSACMKKQGYAYASPMEASNDKRWPAKPGSAEEKATATADAKCKIDNNVTGVWYAVDVAHQKQMIEQHATELAAVRKGIDERLKLAARITAG